MSDTNKKTNFVFERVEKKYLIGSDKFEPLMQKLSEYMQQDEYGEHTICNIYCDTDNFDLIRTSIEKPNYKEKLRIRSYGVPSDNDKVFLEIKKKYKGIVYKRRISLTQSEVMDYIVNGIKPEKESQILNEIDYFIKFYNPKPKVFLAYDRIALFGKEDNDVRITFDKNIRSRRYDLDLSMGDYGEELIEDEYHLMEIKVANSMPLWMVNILSELEIYPVSFSKYGNVYKNNMMKGMEICLQV